MRLNPRNIALMAVFAVAWLGGCDGKPVCGDRICEAGESSCVVDCVPPMYCGDGICTSSEMLFCMADCMSNDGCGDGFCDVGRESVSTCYIDCFASAGYCGDGYCDTAGGETSSCVDCQASTGYCGDGICQSGESCSSDCQVTDCWARNPPPTANVELFNVANYMQQSCDQWCWASCATMLANYFGMFASQCTLMSYKTGYADLNTCCQYAACSYQPCNSGASDQQVTYLISTTFGLNVSLQTSPITEVALVNELANQRPVEISYRNSFAGHVVLITGLQYWGPGQYTYTVMDPYYGIQQGVSYTQLLYGYMGGGQSWYWANTWYRIAPASGGCPL